MLAELYALPAPAKALAGEIADHYLRLHPDKQVQILEIGAGTGGTTSQLLPLLSAGNYQYHYSDISPVLLTQAQAKFSDYSLHYQVLDIEKDPLAQGFTAHSFNLVIAANVLHATADLSRTFAHVNQLLAADGLLIMVETTLLTRFADLIFGITPGWWKFQGCRWRQQSPLLTRSQWATALPQLGFTHSKVLPADDRQSVRHPFSVIIAQGPTLTARQAPPAAALPGEQRQSRPLPATPVPVAVSAPLAKADSADNTTIAEPVSEVGSIDVTRRYLLARIAAIIDCRPEEIDVDAGFLYLGVDSLSLVALTSKLEEQLGVSLYPTLFFEYQTVNDLARYLVTNYPRQCAHLSTATTRIASAAGHRDEVVPAAVETRATAPASMPLSISAPANVSLTPAPPALSAPTPVSVTDVAVIGMAGSFPGAADLRQYWQVISSGHDCIREIGPERWPDADCYDARITTPHKTYCKWGGLLDGIELFDARFFNISPKEAARLDPQQRLFLQTVYHAMENAGYGGTRLYNSDTGVFVGVSNQHYYSQSFDPNDTFSVLASQNGMVANRVSYFMNFTGPSLAIDTQCSSSLVALHYACNSVRSGECGIAIAGGVNCLIPADYYILLSQIKALASDGRCKTFDKSADGFVSGEGVCALVLKPLAQAIADGDHIHVVIKSTAVNHDGRANNVTAPNPNAQAAVITSAWQRAQVDPETISYLEAHGTGTALGDPVEILALTRSFAGFTARKGFCAIGSVKSNIGHLEATSGLAGVIKVALAMQHGKIPPSLHFRQANPHLNFVATPFYVSDKLADWHGQGPRRAGISSFGMGGGNAHVVVEQAPYRVQSCGSERPLDIFTLSAKSEKILSRLVATNRDYLEAHSHQRLADLCYSANAGRGHYHYRLAIVTNASAHLGSRLRRLASGGLQALPQQGIYYHQFTPPQHGAATRVLLIFGNNADYRQLLPALRQEAALDDIWAQAEARLQLPAQALVDENQWAQYVPAPQRHPVAVFICQYAVARLLAAWGLTPTIVIGWGTGEYTAAVSAGILQWPEALTALAGSATAPQSTPAAAPLMWKSRGDHLETLTAPPGETLGQGQYQRQQLPQLWQKCQEAGIGCILQIGADEELIAALEENCEGQALAFSSLADPMLPPWRALLAAVANAYVHGATIDWPAFATTARPQVVELPEYPFDGKPYWVSAKSSFSPVFAPLAINGLILSNRIVKSGMEIAQAPAGRIGADYLDYYRRWADALLGMNIVGNFIVAANGRSHDRQVCLHQESRQQPQLNELCELVRAPGTAVVIQLNHAGIHANSAITGVPAIAPSPLADINANVMAASEEQIRRIITDFAAAAEIAGQAGANGVQIHAAHEYLVSQFLLPRYNLRHDAWGGTLVNRVRLVREILLAIKQRCQSDLLIGAKLDCARANGLTLEEVIEIARMLAANGLDFLEISRGIPQRSEIDGNSHDYFRQVQAIKAAISIPVIATGGVRSLEEMEHLLQQEQADLIGLARPLLCEPHLARDLRYGRKHRAACQSCSLCYLALVNNSSVECLRNKQAAAKAPALERHLFTRTWKVDQPAFLAATAATGVWVVIGISSVVAPLVEALRQHHRSIVTVVLTGVFSRSDRYHYHIDATAADDYRRLLVEIGADWPQQPLTLIHLGGVASDIGVGCEHLQTRLDGGVYSLLLLAKAMLHSKKAMRLATITSAAQKTTSAAIAPEKSLLIALTRIIPYELPEVAAKAIDFPAEVNWHQNSAYLAQELSCFTCKLEEIAYHNQQRLRPAIAPLANTATSTASNSGISQDGIYLIIGGLSALGLVLADYLAGKKPKAIILSGRRALPAESDWEQWLATHSADADIAGSIQALIRLRKHGVEISYCQADINDRAAMERLLQKIDKRPGKLRGIIHCAGSVDSIHRSLHTKSLDSFRRILQPKVHGTLLLAELTRDADLDFLILCSSIAHLHGQLGAALSDYAVANNFFDYFALSQVEAGRIIAIDWPLWQGIGLGARRAQGERTFAIDPAQGIAIFDYILRHKLSGQIIVVNSDDPNFSLAFFNDQETLTSAEPETATAASGCPEDYASIRQFVVKMLMDLLQLPQAEIDDNLSFSDYGINSVIVTDMVGAIESRYHLYLHPSAVLENPSVAALSKYLLKKCQACARQATSQEQGQPKQATTAPIATPVAPPPSPPVLSSRKILAEDSSTDPMLSLLKGLAGHGFSVTEALECYRQHQPD